jgi:hypothetical protein
MTVEFFNFGNDPTYRLFLLVGGSGAVSGNGLLSGIWKKDEEDGKHEPGHERPVHSDRSRALDKLAERLEEILVNRMDAFIREYIGRDGMVWSVGTGSLREGFKWKVGPATANLMVPVLFESLRRIDFRVAAEAILTAAEQSGKWPPAADPDTVKTPRKRRRTAEDGQS